MNPLDDACVDERSRPLVVAVGNRFRSDDGVAGVVLDRLAAMAVVTERADLVELDGEPARLVENPGSKMNRAMRSSSIRSISPGVARPRSSALAAIRPTSRPLPSSATTMVIVPPSWAAEMRIVPRPGLPARRRS